MGSKTCRDWRFRNPSALWWGHFAEMAKFLVLVKPRPSSPPPTQKKEFLKSGRNRVKSGEIGRNRVKLGSGGPRWALGGRLWAGRGTPHILDTFFSCEAIFAAVCVTVLVPGEATVRNISKKCCHKMALSLVIIVSFRKLLTYFAETKVSGEATVRIA